ncbi:MAG: DNA-directed RNA polymerase subunit beta [Candidatus Delongbacteria bacterium]|nr:DNA-directed RNA polymerase subunit beta [Candidatus Delongbacteria bacterium]
MKAQKLIERQSFASITPIIEMPDMLGVQLDSFEQFLQRRIAPEKRESNGLQGVFLNIFPIMDNREESILEYIEYYIEHPKYNVTECIERGLTYNAPLKVKLRVTEKTEDGTGNSIESNVYFGNVPMMTDTGTFIINGAERVIVNQLHRSPGVFYGVSIHTNGTPLYSARIIPFRGSWVEFTTDINDVIHVVIDRRKKFPVTLLLRALGFSRNADIFDAFGLSDTVAVSNKNIKEYYDRRYIDDIIDPETGEVIAERNEAFTAEHLKAIRKVGIKRLDFYRHKKENRADQILINTINKDKSSCTADAISMLYSEMRGGEAPDQETAFKLLERMFFDEKRYDLGLVGRYRINTKLGLHLPADMTVLATEDFIAILKYLIELKMEKRSTDDIDHLGNRRVRTVGEQLANQFSVAFTRMARNIKERMNMRDSDKMTPQELVNVRTITSVVNSFFGTNQLSQFMDQINPLAEVTHKRRVSALGAGGLTRERAGFEVRDVHYTHYGRLCPIEAPEGPNIGLISSLSTYARINEMGFIETPYRRVRGDKVSRQIEYLSADDEDKVVIAQANAPLDENSEFINETIKARQRGEFPVVTPDKVQFMDVIPHQMVSVAAACIPFLEHDDANRALMGANMQRQAVPLLQPEAPIVGTGMERRVAQDSSAVVTADVAGTVVRVDATEIVIRPRQFTRSQREQRPKIYQLRKFIRTNQNTTILQKPLVQEGDIVKVGDIIADGTSTERGDLALGRNVLVAFMPWHGYNFEDSVVISERLVAEDIFTSIHIHEEELEVRETKRGEEELTSEIPNVTEEATADLDQNGIIRVGARVNPNDIIIGKVTPKGEMEATPEDKLLKAIFGEKAGDVKDASKYAGPGENGVVINTKLFSRKKKTAKVKREEKKQIDQLERKRLKVNEELREQLREDLTALLADKEAGEIRSATTQKLLMHVGNLITDKHLRKFDLDDLEMKSRWTDDEEINQEVKAVLDNYHIQQEIQSTEFRNDQHKIQVGDELPPGIVQIAKVYIAQKRKLQVGDKMAGRHGNKGVVGKVVPVEDMPFMDDGTPVDIILNPLGVPSRMNLGQILETSLGWAGKQLGIHYSTPVFNGASLTDINLELEKAGLPTKGKINLNNGKTGKPLDQEVTVGYIYMLKLNHLVDDKVHARSTGPYSLITQQPLGGKAQFGGQRFGEMEVWALEAYGASHILQEIMTIKSDDVQGRSRTFEAIVKGKNIPRPGIPEAFNVLIHEMKGLGLDVNLKREN